MRFNQLPDACLAAALALRLMLPSIRRCPSSAASLLLLATALVHSSPDDAPCLPAAFAGNSSSSPARGQRSSLRQVVDAAAM